MSIKHYDVVRAASPSDLAEKLTHKLKEGWQPYGGPVAITPYTLMQAVAIEGEPQVGPSSEPDWYYVIVLAGQSNAMAYGEGLPLPDSYDAPDPRIKQLARRSTVTPGGAACRYNDIIPADHCLHDVQDMSTLNHPRADLSKGQYGCVGQGLHIAKKLLPYIPNNAGILLVPCCRGGSAFTQGAEGTFSESTGASQDSARWGVGKPLYQDLISRTKAALQKNPKNVLLAVCWMQGEFDMSAATHAQQPALFTAMLTQFRADLSVFNAQCHGGSAADVPWVCGDTTYYWKNTYANSANIVQSSPCQTVSFAGKEYELKVIDEKTPILFQWFEPNPERYKKDEVPIVNTKQHPYLDNVTNAARIESDRMIGIFVDGDFSVNQKTAFSKLERDFENVMIIYREDVDFSMYDRKLSDIYHDIICEQRLRTEDKRDEYLLNLLEKELREISKEQDSLISMYAKKRNHAWFDFFRNLALLKAGEIFRCTYNTKNHGISFGEGCIYLDMDMILTGKLGTIYAPDGISMHVDRRNDSVNIENSAIIVNRSNHPALLEGLSFMHSKVDAHPYYDGLGKGVKKYFNFTPLHNYNHFCDFIEFKHPNMIMNTSQYTCSSW